MLAIDRPVGRHRRCRRCIALSLALEDVGGIWPAFCNRKMADHKKAIANTLKAMETGVSTTTLPERFRELELEKIYLEEEEKRAPARNISEVHLY